MGAVALPVPLPDLSLLPDCIFEHLGVLASDNHGVAGSFRDYWILLSF
jgi:hypothetical protein